MKIIKAKKPIIKCDRCKSIIKYNKNDVFVANRSDLLISQYDFVTCPVCGRQINLGARFFQKTKFNK